MSVISMNFLLESGVHFGHQTKRWNPKMNEYIFTARDDIYIIDLQKTVKKIEEAYEALNAIAVNGGKVLFVGTKKQAQEAVKEEATRSEMYYVNERWLGGTLTNFRTIRKRIYRMEDIEKMEKDGVFELLPKKEVIQIKKEYDKLVKYLSGIRDMKKVPEAMIIVDPRKEMSAIKEARRLKIPVFGIVDTNCDPDDVDYVIPGNDDAVRAVKVVLGVLTNAINAANGGEIVDYINEEDKKKAVNIANNIVKKAELEKEKIVVEEKKVEIEEEVKEEIKEEVKPKKVVAKKAEEVKEEVKPKKVVAKKAEEVKEEVKPKKVVAKKETEVKEKKTTTKKKTEEKPKIVKKTTKKNEEKEIKKTTVKKAIKKEEK